MLRQISKTNMTKNPDKIVIYLKNELWLIYCHIDHPYITFIFLDTVLVVNEP